MTDEIAISEMFYSIQGEGRYAGTPSVFVRKSFCNLRCGGWHNDEIEKQEDMYAGDDAKWVCDSIEAFSNPVRRDLPSEIAEDIADQWGEYLSTGAHLILTGGEPTMPGADENLAAIVRSLGYPFTEVETNGTIKPSEHLQEVANQWNVSLKLSNSGMPEDKRINPEVVRWHVENETSDFKFVVFDEDDMQEVWDLVTATNMEHGDVWLMPAGYTQEDLAMSAPRVAEICKDHGFKYSPRIHVDIWDQATGV